MSVWQQHLRPAELVSAALDESLGRFVVHYSDAGFALVRVPDDGVELAAGLSATLGTGEGGAPVRPTLAVMSFATAMHDPRRDSLPDERITREGELDAPAIKKLLADAPHFIIPLRKRADAEAAFMERISVGRARNKDIVLRHASISKFHGWFQVDEANTVYFADAGSKNGTRVDGQTLTPREPIPLKAGSALVIGRVQVTYCPTDLLWNTLRLP